MEIFVGTYMRRWLYPCPSPEIRTDNSETGLFSRLRFVLAFSFFLWSLKKQGFFGGKNLRFWTSPATALFLKISSVNGSL